MLDLLTVAFLVFAALFDPPVALLGCARPALSTRDELE
jgi:hypothetical protein